MTALAIGSRFPGAPPRLAEGCHYTYDAGGHSLVVAASGPSSDERAASLSPAVTAALHGAIAAQAAAPWDARAYDAHLARLTRERSEDLAARAQTRCAVGA